MKPERKCPKCGGPLANDLAAGLCPKCLVQISLGEIEIPEVSPVNPPVPTPVIATEQAGAQIN
jgi:NMD protein affecting ribosome stability and mRNA decay